MPGIRILDGFYVKLESITRGTQERLKIPDNGLEFEMRYADPDRVEYEPSMLWLDIAGDLQRLTNNYCAHFPNVTIRTYHPRSKGSIELQFAYLRDYLLEPKATPGSGHGSLLDWLQQFAKGYGDKKTERLGCHQSLCWPINDDEDDDEWELFINENPFIAYPNMNETPKSLDCAEFFFHPGAGEISKVVLPELPKGLYMSFAEWKRHRMRVLKLGAGMYLSDHTEKR